MQILLVSCDMIKQSVEMGGGGLVFHGEYQVCNVFSVMYLNTCIKLNNGQSGNTSCMILVSAGRKHHLLWVHDYGAYLQSVNYLFALKSNGVAPGMNQVWWGGCTFTSSLKEA